MPVEFSLGQPGLADFHVAKVTLRIAAEKECPAELNPNGIHSCFEVACYVEKAN